MPSDKVNNKKRQLMRSTLGLGIVGSALPSAWTKPIVSAVVLPAHAEGSTTPPPTTLPPEEPSFSVEKTQSGGANPVTLVGDVIEYEIVVTNTGNVDLTQVVATDTLPDGTVVVLSDQVESMTADNILEVGETWTYETMYTATQDDIDAAADLVNSVSVEVDELPDPEIDDADTPVEPAVCPDLLIDNISFSPQSSMTTPCGISFELLSSDPDMPLMITSITNDVQAPAVVDDNGQFEVTATTGLVVSWLGQALGACLVDAEPIFDVAFTVTAECEAVPGEEVLLEFSLSDLEGVTVV